MPKTTSPKRPTDNWQQLRDEWVAEITRLIEQAEVWSERRGWGTLREERALTEDRIGRYCVPVLLVHAPQGRLLFSPVARFVVGADGLLDISAYPSFDALSSLVKSRGAWHFKSIGSEKLSEKWSEKAFVKQVQALLEP